jgi:hypothetical protein
MSTPILIEDYFLSKYVRNGRVSTLIKLADALNVSLDDLCR